MAKPIDSTEKKGRLGRPPGPSGVINTIEVLRSFTAHEPVRGVTEIATRIGLHRSSVSRILSALEAVQFVEREPDSGRFRLGPGLIALTGQVLTGLGIVEVARPVLLELASRTGETASLSILNEGAVLVVDQVLGPGPIHTTVPKNSPAHCTATGRVLLAFGDAQLIERVLKKGLSSETSRTVVDEEELRGILSKVRRAGSAVVNGEFLDQLAGVAAPILDHRSAAIGAMSVAVPAFGFTRERREQLVMHVSQAAERVSTLMGYRT